MPDYRPGLWERRPEAKDVLLGLMEKDGRDNPSYATWARTLAMRLGEVVTPSQVRHKVLRELGSTGGGDPESLDWDAAHLPSKDEPKYWSRLEGVAETWRENNAPAGFYSIDLAHETAPIALVHSSDWHIGAKATDYRQLRKDLKLIVDTPGAYLVGGGDMTHNHKPQRRSGTALYETIASPDEQASWFEDIVAEVLDAGKFLGLATGNHDNFDVDEAGRHLLKAWCERAGVPFWGHGGTIKVKVGTEVYYGVVRHEYPGASSTNPGNNQRRLFDSYARPREAAHLDWVYLGHLHYNQLEQADRASGECHYLRGSSYLLYSEYVDQKLGVWATKPGSPCVIAWPDNHEMMSFKGTRLETALEFLTIQRSKYKEAINFDAAA